MGELMDGGTPQFLTENAFGVEGVHLTQHILDIEDPTAGHVLLQVHIWQRDQNPHIENPDVIVKKYESGVLVGEETKHADQQSLVLGFGIGANGLDSPAVIASMGSHFKTIVLIDQPDAPSSTILRPAEGPLNNDGTFSNSGLIAYRAVEELVKRNVLQDGEVTVGGFSTFGAVAKEMVKHDILEAEKSDHTHERYIKNLLLFSPAGFFDNPDVIKGAIKQTISMRDRLADIGRHIKGKFQKHPINTENWTDTKHVAPQEGEHILNPPRTWRVVRQNIVDTWKKPWSKSAKVQHTAIEGFEFAFGGRLFSRLMANFHRIWPDQQNAHIHPGSASFAENMRLIKKDVTKTAREKITNTNTMYFLMDEDQIVPAYAALKPEDITQMNEMVLSGEDAENLERFNTHELHKLTPDQWLKTKKTDFAMERILKNVKAMFPKNGDQTHVFIGNGDHFTFRLAADVYAPVIARILMGE
jgi:hypothetical protein